MRRTAMFDPAITTASLTPEQKHRLRELLRARKLPRVTIDDELHTLRLLNLRADSEAVSALNNWGWKVALNV